MKNVIIVIRYSIVSLVNKAWIISRTDYDEYKEKIFSDERLTMHGNLFSEVTMPSIISASEASPDDVQVSLIVLTSDKLPAKYRDQLETSCALFPRSMIVDVAEDEDYIKVMEKSVEKLVRSFGSERGVYATVRLDDDDALSLDFMKQISPYISECYHRHCVTFALGYKAFYKEGSIRGFIPHYFPMIAQGLSLIWAYDTTQTNCHFRTIYGVGDHAKVDRKLPVILDSRSPAYIWTMHEASDMASKDKSRFHTTKDFSDTQQVINLFSISENIIVRA